MPPPASPVLWRTTADDTSPSQIGYSMPSAGPFSRPPPLLPNRSKNIRSNNPPARVAFSPGGTEMRRCPSPVLGMKIRVAGAHDICGRDGGQHVANARPASPPVDGSVQTQSSPRRRPSALQRAPNRARRGESAFDGCHDRSLPGRPSPPRPPRRCTPARGRRDLSDDDDSARTRLLPGGTVCQSSTPARGLWTVRRRGCEHPPTASARNHGAEDHAGLRPPRRRSRLQQHLGWVLGPSEREFPSATYDVRREAASVCSSLARALPHRYVAFEVVREAVAPASAPSAASQLTVR
ncbi:hypothetical protein PHLGIDRAFT_487740 [Phlebiopsis gigantea 11061_1 CR5-6]|uniref:Uncharacterized protein n=1 Tax=Phlebiopsis gigantea (strain 11061_1 CR5-6) TaxID=745531 RepID=A0A0C3S8W6_PHLG1|nr:hypothetical protein PHLGIDRAFT_487740 [Phlebiopsis gigantea 11061_1 CR5-6]